LRRAPPCQLQGPAYRNIGAHGPQQRLQLWVQPDSGFSGGLEAGLMTGAGTLDFVELSLCPAPGMTIS